jgi:hypothetical protein
MLAAVASNAAAPLVVKTRKPQGCDDWRARSSLAVSHTTRHNKPLHPNPKPINVSSKLHSKHIQNAYYPVQRTVCILAGVAAHAAALPVVGAHQAAVAELARVPPPRILRGMRKRARAPVVLQAGMRFQEDRDSNKPRQQGPQVSAAAEKCQQSTNAVRC